MAVRDLGYSRERALEQIGETDAKEVMAQAEQEQIEAVKLEIRKRRLAAEAEAELRALASEPSRRGFDPAAGGLPPVVADPEGVASAQTAE
jgi:hypothetical protein